MPTETTTPRTAVFGPYSVDLRSGELRKHGTRLKLGEQPLQILLLLLERRGQLVTREELGDKLWPRDTFVDFDHGLNSAVQRLRDCLSDSAGQARWIETVPRRGYRFLGEVEWRDESSDPAPLVPKNGNGFGAEKSTSQNEAVPASRKGPWALVVVAVTLAVVGSAWVYQRRTRPPVKQAPVIRSMAVLPLENLSGDPQQDYFADGITDELITMLAKNASLRVISRTTVMQYKGVHRPLRDIARELGVDGVVEGSVVRTGERVRVTAQLIHAASDTHLWAESYERDVRDVIALQKEVAQSIAARVNTNLSPSNKPVKVINPEAHDAYLRGRYYWFSDAGFEKSREYFEKAIQLQRDYAAPWSGLADFCTVQAKNGNADPRTMRPKAEEFARKALELDESLPEAHNTLAAIKLFLDWDWEGADWEAQRAIALNPSFAEAHHLRCYILQASGHLDEAIEEARKAIELDPRARPWGLGQALILARRYDAALEELKARSVAYPSDADLRWFLGTAYQLSGNETDAVVEWTKAQDLSGEERWAAEAKRAMNQGGYRAVLDLQLVEVQREASRKYVSPLRIAAAYAELGDKEQALRYLEIGYEHRTPELVWVHLEPVYDFLHSDPRFQALVKKIGLTLPPSQQAVLH
jgi:TolB-like protein/DNA-binding winged helix-turn-helix (wHTH) protein/Flp pilus assembly protein TadD